MSHAHHVSSSVVGYFYGGAGEAQQVCSSTAARLRPDILHIFVCEQMNKSQSVKSLGFKVQQKRIELTERGSFFLITCLQSEQPGVFSTFTAAGEDVRKPLRTGRHKSHSSAKKHGNLRLKRRSRQGGKYLLSASEEVIS